MTAEQAAHGLRTLNRIIDRWQASRLYVWAITEVVATVSGASATIGAGLQFDVAHPQKLNPGCFYVRSGMSFPLPVWQREDYNAVILKAQAGEYPQGVYYDRQNPGHVYVWPVPSAPLEYHLQVYSRLPVFADLDIDYKLPDGYADALFYTLTERLPAAYNLPVSEMAVAEAAKARRVIKAGNNEVPVLQIGGQSGRLNILTNQRN
jgi:hypothetical protein